MTEHQSQYLLLFAGLVAVAILILAIALAAVAFAVAKLAKQLTAFTEEARGKVYPLMDKIHPLVESAQTIALRAEGIVSSAEEMVADAAPKLKRVTANIAETSDVYRAKVAEVDALLTDTTTKVRRQSDRVDGMVTSALTRTGEVAAHMQHAIMAPARQLSGIVNGAKTSIDHLIHQFGPKRRPRVPKAIAFEGESVYTGEQDDYHA